MEGQHEEPNIVEQYSNSDGEASMSLVVGFTNDRAAYMKRKILDDSDDWTVWEPIGSSADYLDNQHFASLNGCSFKLDENP